MALPNITAADFRGWININANTFKEDKLTEYITLFQENYLRLIVGDAAYSDISAQTRQKWTDLLNGVDFVDINGKRKNFAGLVKPLKYFIYFEFVRDDFTATQPGHVHQKAENSERATGTETGNVARSRHNAAVRLINGPLTEFLEAYEEFEETITASVDNGDNTYTLDIGDTTYLEAGDTVTIGGTEYTVTAVTEDISITINAGETGLDFSGDLATWEPFEDVDFCKLDFAGL